MKIKYVITDKKQKLFLGRDKLGKYIKTVNIDKAETYDALLKANNVIKNCLSKTDKIKWESKLIEDIKQENKKQLKNTLRTETFNDYNILLDKIQEIEDIKQAEKLKYEQQREVVRNQQSKIDSEISDIYHYIAFEKVSVCKWVKIYKILMQVLIDRAHIKQQLIKLNVIIESFNQPFNRQIIENQLLQSEYQPYKPRTEIWDILTQL